VLFIRSHQPCCIDCCIAAEDEQEALAQKVRQRWRRDLLTGAGSTFGHTQTATAASAIWSFLCYFVGVAIAVPVKLDSGTAASWHVVGLPVYLASAGAAVAGGLLACFGLQHCRFHMKQRHAEKPGDNLDWWASLSVKSRLVSTNWRPRTVCKVVLANLCVNVQALLLLFAASGDWQGHPRYLAIFVPSFLGAATMLLALAQFYLDETAPTSYRPNRSATPWQYGWLLFFLCQIGAFVTFVVRLCLFLEGTLAVSHLSVAVPLLAGFAVPYVMWVFSPCFMGCAGYTSSEGAVQESDTCLGAACTAILIFLFFVGGPIIALAPFAATTALLALGLDGAIHITYCQMFIPLFTMVPAVYCGGGMTMYGAMGMHYDGS
jgi:hypothetical protein